jgi:hypothetical protein
MGAIMKDRKITRERLEYLLENWGKYVTVGAPVGPQVPTRCGSVESQYAADPSRYVWEGRAYVPRGTGDMDESLAVLTEKAVLTLCDKYQHALVMRYGKGLTLVAIAMNARCSLPSAEAMIASATIAVWEHLESESWQKVA